MKRTFTARVLPIGLGVAGLLAASMPSAYASTKTLTVWLMVGGVSPQAYNAVDAAFDRQHPGVRAHVEIQQWTDIESKLDAGLASSSPPDVVEIGNTLVPTYAEAGALANVASTEAAINESGKWLTSLQGPATIGGKIYAVPLYSGDRVVIYNKTMWKEAGITQLPTSLQQLIADGVKLDKKFASVKDFSAVYIYGQNWYAGVPALYDHGGSIAAHKDGKWVAQLTSRADIAGLKEYKLYQNSLSSVASRTQNGTVPDPDSLVASGSAAAIYGDEADITAIRADNKSIQLGEFPMPSYKGGAAPVFLGGSDIAVAANSPNKALAEDWVKLVASPRYQTLDYKTTGFLPNTTGLLGKLGKTEFASAATMKPFLTAAEDSFAVPKSPGWSVVESTNLLEDMLVEIATAKSDSAIPAIAKLYDARLNHDLNQSS